MSNPYLPRGAAVQDEPTPPETTPRSPYSPHDYQARVPVEPMGPIRTETDSILAGRGAQVRASPNDNAMNRQFTEYMMRESVPVVVMDDAAMGPMQYVMHCVRRMDVTHMLLVINLAITLALLFIVLRK